MLLDIELDAAPSSTIAKFSSFRGDFRRTLEDLAGSARGCAGALGFLTTGGGIDGPRELIEESGRIL